MRVLIAVTHLLGAGHLTRAAALARALAARGHRTVLVSGGRRAPLVRCEGVAFVQLPPVHVEGSAFARLLDGEGREASAAHLHARRRRLLDALAETAPDIVVTELFPFGRRVLASEFAALVEAAHRQHPRPAIVASIRDILVAPVKPGRIEAAHERLARHYDAVLVHGDPALVALDASWPVADGLAGKLRYTGYVDEGDAVTVPGPRAGIVVAAGSGGAGLGLLRAAAGAARTAPELGWRILAGHGVPEAVFRTLARHLPGGVLSRARPDYRALLTGAAVSVSQCGYNTAVDLLATGSRAVLVPFEAGRETEQRLRADFLAARGLGRVVPEADLSPETLVAAVRAALAAPPPPAHGIDFSGAAASVAILEDLARPSPRAHRAQDADGRDRLRAALDAAGEAGTRIRVWWRDDDAVAATPALDRLIALADAHAAPLLVAAIPAGIEPSLGARVSGAPGIRLAVHGLAHANHAPAGDKPAEFGAHRPLAVLVAQAREALRLARARLPADRLLRVFVPPWNRVAPELAAALPELGYAGLSAAPGPAVAGLVRADGTLDPIDWRGTRSLREPGALLASLADQIVHEPGRPVGLLTHHRAHDAAIWAFLDTLLAVLLPHPAVEVVDPRALFRAAAMDAAVGAWPSAGAGT